MKKILGEYSQIIGYTCTGLIFGLSFFLLFINFYHYKEIGTTVEKTENVENIKGFDVNNYTGSENRYELLSLQSRLEQCSVILENEEVKEMFQKQSMTINDVYKFQKLYQSKYVNDCVVKQLYDFVATGEAENTPFSSNKIKNLTPFMKLEVDYLIKRTQYLSNNIENNSSYYFSNESAKDNIFEITKDSYIETAASYKDVSKFVLELSRWYQKLVGGQA